MGTKISKKNRRNVHSTSGKDKNKKVEVNCIRSTKYGIFRYFQKWKSVGFFKKKVELNYFGNKSAFVLTFSSLNYYKNPFQRNFFHILASDSDATQLDLAGGLSIRVDARSQKLKKYLDSGLKTKKKGLPAINDFLKDILCHRKLYE